MRDQRSSETESSQRRGRLATPSASGVDAPKTAQQLNKHLHFAAENGIPVSTPQLYLDHERRFCDEDTDIGMDYALSRLLDNKVAPQPAARQGGL